MKILYDHQMFSRAKFGGIPKYFCELIKNLPEDYDAEISVLFSNNQHLKDNYHWFKKPYLPIPSRESRLRGHLRAKTYSINQFYSIQKIRKRKYDLFHPTYFDPYFLKVIQKPFIVTVHDLIVFKFPGVLRKEQQMAEMEKIINKAERIIAISENTKKDLIDILRVNPEKIDVIYHGFNRFDGETGENPYGRYILFVGTRSGYKNFKSLALAFKKLIEKDPELKLICVGNAFVPFEIENLKRLRIFDNVLQMGVNERKLNQLYFHALSFVNPSLYEGFGMPLLEAFSNNCPVCLSNSSCFPEIAADAGMYFDPNDPDSISETIAKVIYDSAFSNILRQFGQNRLLSFSWKKCATETTRSYRKVFN